MVRGVSTRHAAAMIGTCTKNSRLTWCCKKRATAFGMSLMTAANSVTAIAAEASATVTMRHADAGRCQASAHSLDQMGKAPISRNGNSTEPDSSGGRSLTSDRATANKRAKESLHHLGEAAAQAHY
jgi:hypothetical protein